MTEKPSPLIFSAAERLARQRAWIADLVLLAGWGWLYAPVWRDLQAILARQEFGAEQLALLGFLALAVVRLRSARLCWPRWEEIECAPRLFWPGLLMVSGGSLLYVLAIHFGYEEGFPASLFGLASYGLAGLWMHPRRWWQGLPACVLLVGALPFGEYLHVFIGFPMRLTTAVLVRNLLAAVGARPLSAYTILIFENGVTQIDLPCSGVKSLWTAWIFLAAAAWIDKRRFGVQWLGAALATGILLFFTNLLRVLALTLLGPVAGWPRLAEMVHLPLGVLGFAGACAAGLRLLRLAPLTKEPVDRIGNFPAGSGERPAWLAPLLAVAILGIGWGATAWLRPSQAILLPFWNFPVELSTRPAPLTAGEREAWNRLQPEAIDRRWFSYTPQGFDHVVNGSMILVVSQDWQAQHRPENCFTVYGLEPVDSFTYLLRPGFPLRVLLLSRITDQRLLAAVYWFQSAAMTTDDYSTRVWADLLPQRQRWVMVTVLFGEPLGAGEQYDPGAAEFRGLYDSIHAAVQEGLEQETTFFDRE